MAAIYCFFSDSLCPWDKFSYTAVQAIKGGTVLGQTVVEVLSQNVTDKAPVLGAAITHFVMEQYQELANGTDITVRVTNSMPLSEDQKHLQKVIIATALVGSALLLSCGACLWQTARVHVLRNRARLLGPVPFEKTRIGRCVGWLRGLCGREASTVDTELATRYAALEGVGGGE
jgi:hypothetical protein